MQFDLEDGGIMYVIHTNITAESHKTDVADRGILMTTSMGNTSPVQSHCLGV